MDGTSRSAIITNLNTPYGLTIDYDTQVLYWTDDGLNRIEMANVDGSNRNSFITSLVATPSFITYYDGVLYWNHCTKQCVLSN